MFIFLYNSLSTVITRVYITNIILTIKKIDKKDKKPIVKVVIIIQAIGKSYIKGLHFLCFGNIEYIKLIENPNIILKINMKQKLSKV